MCFTSSIFFLFSIIHILWSLLNVFVCSLHILGAIDSLYGFQFFRGSYILKGLVVHFFL